MRFTVFADTHYCTLEHRTAQGAVREPLGTLADYCRYLPMMDSVMRPLVKQAADFKPELVISTGDLIEGGADSRRDLPEATALLASIGGDVYRATGSHDLLRPHQPEYQSFTRNGCAFILLDYCAWGDEQRTWLVEQLEQARTAEHVFVFGHAPLYVLARHLFHTPGYADDVRKIVSQYPVDVYFCGHTHNQAVSRHGTMLQIKGSSVGFANESAIPLEQYHSLSPLGEGETYYWGFPEDFQPGFWEVEVQGESLDLHWRGLNNEGRLVVPSRFAQPECVQLPRRDWISRDISLDDFYHLQGAWLNVFGNGRDNSQSRIVFNGIDLGAMPANGCYAGRRFVQLSLEALLSVGLSNCVEITSPADDVFGFGSVSLDLLLLDGRRFRSNVDPRIFICGESPSFEYVYDRAVVVKPGETVSMNLSFAKA